MNPQAYMNIDSSHVCYAWTRVSGSCAVCSDQPINWKLITNTMELNNTPIRVTQVYICTLKEWAVHVLFTPGTPVPLTDNILAVIKQGWKKKKSLQLHTYSSTCQRTSGTGQIAVRKLSLAQSRRRTDWQVLIVWPAALYVRQKHTRLTMVRAM